MVDIGTTVTSPVLVATAASRSMGDEGRGTDDGVYCGVRSSPSSVVRPRQSAPVVLSAGTRSTNTRR